ncbi:hypothetical protein BGZ73_000543, partial [Actinomortierella ambigua]
KHGTSWSESQVKSKIAYVRSKYREAAVLNSPGQDGSVLETTRKREAPLQLDDSKDDSNDVEVYGSVIDTSTSA